MKSAGNWLLCDVIVVMSTEFTVFAEISVSCSYFKFLRSLEERFFRAYVICVIKVIHQLKQ